VYLIHCLNFIEDKLCKVNTLYMKQYF